MAEDTKTAAPELDEKALLKTLNESLGLLGVPVKDRPDSLKAAVDRVKLESVKLLKDFDARSEDLNNARKEIKKLEAAGASPKGDIVQLGGQKFQAVNVHGENQPVIKMRELDEAYTQQFVDENELCIVVKKI